MTDIRSLIDNIETALGSNATAEQVERVARLLLTNTEKETAPAIIATQSETGVSISSATIGISLLDCSSRLPRTVSARAYDKIRRVAGLQQTIISDLSQSLGIPVLRTGITVSPSAVVLDSGKISDFVALAVSLDQACVDIAADFIAGYAAIAHRGMSAGSSSLIDSLPEVIGSTTTVVSSISCGNQSNGLNTSVVDKLEAAVDILLARSNSVGHHGRVFAVCNTEGYDAGLASSFHGIGEAELTINLEYTCQNSSESADGSSTQLVQVADFAKVLAEGLSTHSGHHVVIGHISRRPKKQVDMLQPGQHRSSGLTNQAGSLQRNLKDNLVSAIKSGKPYSYCCY